MKKGRAALKGRRGRTRGRTRTPPPAAGKDGGPVRGPEQPRLPQPSIAGGPPILPARTRARSFPRRGWARRRGGPRKRTARSYRRRRARRRSPPARRSSAKVAGQGSERRRSRVLTQSPVIGPKGGRAASSPPAQYAAGVLPGRAREVVPVAPPRPRRRRVRSRRPRGTAEIPRGGFAAEGGPEIEDLLTPAPAPRRGAPSHAAHGSGSTPTPANASVQRGADRPSATYASANADPQLEQMYAPDPRHPRPQRRVGSRRTAPARDPWR